MTTIKIKRRIARLDPNRGCVHACHDCYARATHAHLGLDAGHDFQTRIFVETNLPGVLRRELARPSWRGERVAIGTATNPYQPGKGRFRVTRGGSRRCWMPGIRERS